MKSKSIELFNDTNFTIDERTDGTYIHGMLAYPGISRNLKLYTIDQIMRGHDKDVPIWLNHADLIGTQDVGRDLLPDSYRERLAAKEPIILGRAHLTFSPDTLQLMYEGVVTDPFYKQKKILKKMSVSQGVLHPQDLEEKCDTLVCYKVIEQSFYEEMSLVFHAGFSIATLSIENQNTYELRNYLENILSKDDTSKSKEADCGCKDSKEVDQASGTMTAAGQCGEGQIYNQQSGKCEPSPTGGNAQSNYGAQGSHGGSGEGSDADGRDIDQFGAIKKAQEKLDVAEKAVETANKELDTAREAMKKKGKEDDGESDGESAKEAEDDEPDDKKKEIDKKSKENSKESGDVKGYPNADARSRAKAQEIYNEAFEKKMKAQESMQTSILALAKANMSYSMEHASREAYIGSNTARSILTKANEATVLRPKQWMDGWIKSPETMTSSTMTYIMQGELQDSLCSRFFEKANEGIYLDKKRTPYKEFMKSIEATDVSITPGTATGDANNFQRTLSELVLVYPNGIVVTPGQQFCETAILPPGKKEHLAADVNVPDFSATDEANMDAAGSGYALAPTPITINWTGGPTTPQGGLVRIGFTQLEEVPIDLVQKINIGYAMRAEQRKNFEIFNTCYNTDTAYAPTTDSKRPKGGGDKGATDNQGNTHWVNGNSGAQLTTTDSGATSALTFAGLLKAKKTIADTGLSVENLQTYLPWGGIFQLLNDTGITTYTQRSVPEVITEGYIEKIAGTQLIASNDLAAGAAAGVVRAVMFLPVVSFLFITGRELQIDLERVARQQSFFASASIKMAAFCKKVESTCRISFKPSA